MIQGLRLPFLSDFDPEIAAEGGIDPLGLASIADMLADSIAPGITARMTRIRYLSAITAAASVLEKYADRATPDGSPPYLVFEWIVVEAFARKGHDLPPDARQIPGIDKARTALVKGEAMCARNYLKTPGVFGFHGVFRTLAESLRLIDRDGHLRTNGERLLRAWESDCGIDGFLDNRPGTPGEAIRSKLDQTIDTSLRTGKSEAKQAIYGELHRLFRPDQVGAREKAVLRELLFDAGEPIRHEVLTEMSRLGPGVDEAGFVDILGRKASAELKCRLDAIRRFENLAEILTRALNHIRFRSSHLGTQPLAARDAENDEVLREAAATAPDAAAEAARALEGIERVDPQALYRARLARFEDRVGPGAFFDLLVAHHEEIQRQKKPFGKRSWFDRSGDGVVVRGPYRRWEPVEASEAFVHPYRLYAISRFLRDLA